MNCKWGAAPGSGAVVRESWEGGYRKCRRGGGLGPRTDAVGGVRGSRRRLARVVRFGSGAGRGAVWRGSCVPDRPWVLAPQGAGRDPDRRRRLARVVGIRIGCRGAVWRGWLGALRTAHASLRPTARQCRRARDRECADGPRESPYISPMRPPTTIPRGTWVPDDEPDARWENLAIVTLLLVIAALAVVWFRLV